MEELALAPEVDVICVNRAGLHHWGRIAGWGSVHGDELKAWADQRAEAGLNTDCPIFSNRNHTQEPVEWYGPCRWPGSSGLYVVQWALFEAKYHHIGLCGIHMDGDTRIAEDGTIENAPMPYGITYQAGWRTAQSYFADRVRSYGGWTAELLGTPDADFWITP
jgi:hypothetical protein